MRIHHYFIFFIIALLSYQLCATENSLKTEEATTSNFSISAKSLADEAFEYSRNLESMPNQIKPVLKTINSEFDLMNFPFDVLINIVINLTIPETANLKNVCYNWNIIFDSSQIWQAAYAPFNPIYVSNDFNHLTMKLHYLRVLVNATCDYERMEYLINKYHLTPYYTRLVSPEVDKIILGNHFNIAGLYPHFIDFKNYQDGMKNNLTCDFRDELYQEETIAKFKNFKLMDLYRIVKIQEINYFNSSIQLQFFKSYFHPTNEIEIQSMFDEIIDSLIHYSINRPSVLKKLIKESEKIGESRDIIPFIYPLIIFITFITEKSSEEILIKFYQNQMSQKNYITLSTILRFISGEFGHSEKVNATPRFLYRACNEFAVKLKQILEPYFLPESPYESYLKLGFDQYKKKLQQALGAKNLQDAQQDLDIKILKKKYHLVENAFKLPDSQDFVHSLDTSYGKTEEKCNQLIQEIKEELKINFEKNIFNDSENDIVFCIFLLNLGKNIQIIKVENNLKLENTNSVYNGISFNELKKQLDELGNSQDAIDFKENFGNSVLGKILLVRYLSDKNTLCKKYSEKENRTNYIETKLLPECKWLPGNIRKNLINNYLLYNFRLMQTNCEKAFENFIILHFSIFRNNNNSDDFYNFKIVKEFIEESADKNISIAQRAKFIGLRFGLLGYEVNPQLAAEYALKYGLPY